MIRKEIESKLIEYCSPTLAGLKSGSLFSYFYHGQQIAAEEFEKLNRLLNTKGVNLEVLIWREQSALVYVYRTTMLESELKQPGVLDFLNKYGYKDYNIDSCLKHLKQRIMTSSCFPHEIGVFLGYPLEDVEGFIDNNGKNCKSCGVWKVYCNEEEKDVLFKKFKKCKEVYLRVFCEGKEILHMTVCT